MDDLQKRNKERWDRWMEYEGGKYGRFLVDYDEEKLRIAMSTRRKRQWDWTRV